MLNIVSFDPGQRFFCFSPARQFGEYKRKWASANMELVLTSSVLCRRLPKEAVVVTDPLREELRCDCFLSVGKL